MVHNFYIGSEEVLIPDIPTTIVGFRQWKLNARDLTLNSRVVWPHNDVLKAECLSYYHTNAYAASCMSFPYIPATEKTVLDEDADHDIPSAPDQEIAAKIVSWDFDNNKWTATEKADIKTQKHPQPGCGIYCFKEFEQLISHPFYHKTSTDIIVTGTIEIGGRVWPHQKGYRSEYAMVSGIFCTSKRHEEIAFKYDAEMLDMTQEQEDFLREYAGGISNG